MFTLLAQEDAVQRDTAQVLEFEEFAAMWKNWKAFDFYATLGISPPCVPRKIRKAYHALAMLCHPDKQAQTTDPAKLKTREDFATINCAYECLKGPWKGWYDKVWKKLHESGHRAANAKAANLERHSEASLRATPESPGAEPAAAANADERDGCREIEAMAKTLTRFCQIYKKELATGRLEPGAFDEVRVMLDDGPALRSVVNEARKRIAAMEAAPRTHGSLNDAVEFGKNAGLPHKELAPVESSATIGKRIAEQHISTEAAEIYK